MNLFVKFFQSVPCTLQECTGYTRKSTARLGIFSITLLFLLTVSANAQFTKQHRTSDAPFLKPEEAVAAMDIPDGFEVSIFAAEPDIGEPIAFTFDERGRVWVVENYNYINRKSHEEKKILSRIQIFEDTDGDGVFDTKKLFTDKIGFASGIAVGFGGIYLGAPPNLLFIPDADGDDVPDGKPEVLLDGWGIHDRHETLNSFLWGPDGWLYGCHGVFTRSFVGKPGAAAKDRTYIDAGIWRFHPVKKEFEIFARGLSNPWGFDFNDVGHGFATCCVIPHLFHVVQSGVYHKQARPNLNPYVFDNIKTIRDHTHLSAHGGARFYLADTFPKVFHNHLFMCNIHQHEVLTDYMVPKGSSYIGKHGYNFLPTNDMAWVGFSVEIGPEGGVYILDWHDTDICGNKINFPESGRIYRIMPKGAKKIQRPDVGSLTDMELVQMQYHSNDWYVRQARVELHHRTSAGKLNTGAVHAPLDIMLKSVDTTGKRLRALWAMHVTGRFGEGQRYKLVELLGHEDQHVRAWAVQLLCEDGKPGEAALAKFAAMAKNDPSPVVRLYLASACHRIHISQAWEIIAELAKHSEDIEDNNIPRVLWLALEPHVTTHPDKALEVAINGKIPFLLESVSRRMVSGSPKTWRRPSRDLQAKWGKALRTVAPGFRPDQAGEGGVVALNSFRNVKAVQTHPFNGKTPCILEQKLHVPKDKVTRLRARVSYHPHGSWRLRVRALQEVLLNKVVNFENVKAEWLDVDVDLSKFAGKNIVLTLENASHNGKQEYAYWGKVEVVSGDTVESLKPLSQTTAPVDPRVPKPTPEWQNLIGKVAPGFKVSDAGVRGVGEEKNFRGETVVRTHPLNQDKPCVLTRKYSVPKDKETVLKIRVSSHQKRGDWELRVLAGKDLLQKSIVGPQTSHNGWLQLEIPLTKYAGKTIDLTLENRANDWHNEFGYWSKVELLSFAKSAAVSPQKAKGPNIVFFLVDDLGWSDIACYGSTFYDTPRVDQLAKEGVRFTDAYAACHVCSPTRASILTGKYPASLNLTDWLRGRRDFPFQKLKNAVINQNLPYEETTIAEKLKSFGYATGIFGKWHLGRKPSDPTAHGFDIHTPDVPSNWRTFHGPFGMKTFPSEKGDYLTDRITDEAIEWVTKNKDKPFFLYMSHFAVHDPIQGRKDLVEKYTRKLERMEKTDSPDFILEVNPDNPDNPSKQELAKLIDTPEFAPHKVLPKGTIKIRQKQDNIEFAAMVESVDQSLGRIIDKLGELGIEDNTIVIFFSDNGGMAAMNVGNPKRIVQESDIDRAYATSSLPLRGAKGWLYEGGIRVPLIIKWPKQGKAGAVCSTPVHSVDFFPTLMEMIGKPDEIDNTLEGVSLASLVKGEDIDQRSIFWHFPHYSNHGMHSPGGAIRSGNYKLLEYFENGSVQLFDLENDIGEQVNLASSQPDRAKALQKELHQWRDKVGAQMMAANPDYDPAIKAEDYYKRPAK